MPRVQGSMITIMAQSREDSPFRARHKGFLWRRQSDEGEINTVLRECVEMLSRGRSQAPGSTERGPTLGGFEDFPFQIYKHRLFSVLPRLLLI